MTAWGGERRGSGRKPDPNSKRQRAMARKADRKFQVVGGTDQAAKAPAEPKAKLPSLDAIAEIIRQSNATARSRERQPEMNPFQLPVFPPQAMPPSNMQMAMDESSFAWGGQQWGAGGSVAAYAAEGLVFLGYPYLAELAQRSEYRIFSETIATEMTRKWIKFSSTGKNKKKKPKAKTGAEDRAPEEVAESAGEASEPTDKEDNEKTEKIKELVDFLDHLKVRDRFAELAAQDGFFGRAHLYLDADAKDEELKTSVGAGRDDVTKGKVGKGWLKRIKTIEAVWAYPTTYNSSQPLAPDWYDPQVWYVMGQQIHRTRLLRFVGREVPDLLKPAYAFGGLSLSQLAKPYVDIWLKTRESVGELIHAFSVMVLHTDLQTLLQPGQAANLLGRVALFNALRDNQGAFVVNKSTEDFTNVSAPLSGLDALQAQSQEHMMSVARIPAVKFTGISPMGLNASSEGEMRAFNDTIHAYQGKLFKPNLDTVIDLAMITLWGARDPEITYEFESLVDLTEKERGEKRKAEAETGQIHIDTGVISPEEERRRIVTDPESAYQGLDPDDVPEPPEDPNAGDDDRPGFGAGGGGEDPAPKPKGRPGAEDANLLPFGLDAEWEEGEHPRAPDGKFGYGGSKKGSGSAKGGAKPSSSSTGSIASALPYAAEILSNPNFRTTKEMLNQRLATVGGKQPLDDDEIAVSRAYMAHGSAAINSAASHPLTDNDRIITATMDRMLAKLPRYTGTATRLMQLTPEQVAKIFEPGATIQWPAYSSAKEGTKGAVATVGGNVEIAIESKGGAHKFSAISAFGSEEREVIFGRGTQFKVGTVKKAGNKYKITLTEVPRQGQDALFNDPDLDTAYWVRATEHRRYPEAWPAPSPPSPGGGRRAVLEEPEEGAEDEWNEGDHPRGQPGNPGQFGSGGGGATKSEKDTGSSSEQPVYKTKKEHAASLLEKGTTAAELMTTLGWPSISVPAMAKSLGMNLSKTKEGRTTTYTGTPMSPAERKAAGLMPEGVKRSGGPASRDPTTFSLLEFIASKGGIDPKDPLIGDVRGLLGTKNKFVPGFGSLVRPGGIKLDRLREAAVEAGYIQDLGFRGEGQATSTIDTLLESMDRESRGERQYRQGQTPEHVTAARQAQVQEENRRHYEERIDEELQTSGVEPESLTGRQRDRVIEIMEKEGVSDPLEAIEREAMEWVTDASERGTAERILDEIPGWDVPPQPGTASKPGGTAAPF